MKKKTRLIKRLEKQLGKQLEEKPPRDIIYSTINSYTMDKQGKVIALNLYNTGISDISILGKFTHLLHLGLSGNKISNIEPIGNLTQLTSLNLIGNQITQLGPLRHLTALTELYLGNNMITDVEPLGNLTALTNLHLQHNKITDIQPLANLTALTELYVNTNRITDIEPLGNLTALKNLRLNHNLVTTIESLKPLIENGIDAGWDIRNGISLYDNLLEIPPIEVVERGRNAILNYFHQLEAASVRLLQSKLLIVGNGEVGKTTLMKKLLDPAFDVDVGKEPTTHGIKIEPWELDCYFNSNKGLVLEKIKLHFWDFGGQAIYHSTHQFFLTKRSLYLFVWDARKEEETRSFDYWFNIVKLLSASSPVIVVMNKSDIRIKQIDEASFMKKFENIAGFHKVSCVTGDGIEQLCRQIRLCISDMPHLRDKLPKVWVDIRERLKTEGEKKDYISLEDYFAICRQFSMNKNSALFLSDYLHDLGIILHYRHDPLLETTVILNPEWATEAVYTLIDTREIQENKGSFKFRDLERHWDPVKFPVEKHSQLIRLMETFELCFNFTGTDMYIVPELLPAEKVPVNFDKYKLPGNLRFDYHYDFMPEGIITRFISRMYYLIENKHYWKFGVELKFEDSTALVMSKPLYRKIKIAVTGPCKNELLAIIRNDFEYIHQTLNMKKDEHYNEMIPCICRLCCESENPYFFEYKVLKRRRAKSGFANYCQYSDDEVAIEELLTGFERQKPKGSLLKSIITSVHHLQGIAKTIKSDEDSRNGFIALLLSIQGFFVKDQTRWGSSASDLRTGEVDIKVETPGLEAVSIIEAFNLSSIDKKKVNLHLKKIFRYDPNGLQENFIIVYAKAVDFVKLWQRYLNRVMEVEHKYRLKGKPKEQRTPFSSIKLAKAIHERNGEETTVYHIFVNMNV